ncbi:MAG: DNA repair protein RecN, partial [Prevotella sp.]|nr:DNA repair protein RecN [Prevotella sp.]
MLTHLYIKNFTLIDELDMEFRSGFSVITGETGAGKSIILGDIGLLLGQRADLKTIKQGADKCVIEAHFDLSRYQMQAFFEQNDVEYDGHDTIVRRELTAAGKSRSFVNDTPVPLSLLKDLGERLVDVHSQHQNLLLNKHDFQLQVVDIIAKDAKELDAYSQAFSHYQELQRQLENLLEEIEQNTRNKDFLQFQFDELAAARLVADEQEELEARADTMTHAEDIKQAFYKAESHLLDDEGGVVARLKQTASSLRDIERVYPQAAELAERVQSSYIELKDVAAEVSTRLEEIDFDPSELDAVNTRLDRLYDLEKKYHVATVAELLDIQLDLEQRLVQMDNSDEAVDELRRQVDAALQVCQTKADALTRKRKSAAKVIERQMLERLVPLGMPRVRFEIGFAAEPLQRHGQDKVAFLFSANTSTPLQPVAQVASGGEIARVMLAVKAMISGAVKLPTIIFDEIDTGVSGKIAEQMGQMMQEMGAQDRQVI